MKNPQKIAEPRGKLGVLLVGMGAVSTTTIAGVLAIRKGLAKPIGSLTQMGAIRLGKRTEGRSPLIKDFVPLASLDDVEREQVVRVLNATENHKGRAADILGVSRPRLRRLIEKYGLE